MTLKLEYLFERLGTLSDGYYEAKDFVKYLTYSGQIEETPSEAFPLSDPRHFVNNRYIKKNN